MKFHFLDNDAIPKNNVVMAGFSKFGLIYAAKEFSFLLTSKKCFTYIKKVIYLDVNKENIILSNLFFKFSINIAALR